MITKQLVRVKPSPLTNPCRKLAVGTNRGGLRLCSGAPGRSGRTPTTGLPRSDSFVEERQRRAAGPLFNARTSFHAPRDGDKRSCCAPTGCKRSSRGVYTLSSRGPKGAVAGTDRQGVTAACGRLDYSTQG
jgi:hypothetical protein